MKELAQSAQTQILSHILPDPYDDVCANFARQDSCKLDTRHQQHGTLQADPQTLSDLVILDECTTTGGENPLPFLILDSDPEEYDRVVAFANLGALNRLCNSDTWHIDGTFYIAPHLFKQLCVIRAEIGDSAVSCVYTLVTGRHQELYKKLQQVVTNECSERKLFPDPTAVVTDFEKASLQAVTNYTTQNTGDRFRNLASMPIVSLQTSRSLSA